MKTIDLTDEELAIIQEMRRKKAEEKAKEWQPRAIISFAVEEKIAFFDKMYEIAIGEYCRARDTGFDYEDKKQWPFELMMGLLGADVWKSYNKFTA